METNIDGAILTPNSIKAIKYFQEEDNVSDFVAQIDEAIDFVIAEDIPMVSDSDTNRIRIIRNLRYISQKLLTFKISPNNEH